MQIKKRILLLATLVLTLISVGCRHRHANTARLPPQPKAVAKRKTPVGVAVPVGYTEEGIASWYGVPYHGRPAADGEIYDMEKLVAAHRVIPFNTWIKVTNLSNNQSVNVRIIDRGPFVHGRNRSFQSGCQRYRLARPWCGQSSNRSDLRAARCSSQRLLRRSDRRFRYS